jgi:hypothetical protein
MFGRVAFATGERLIPAWVTPSAIDEHLGAHVDGTPRVAATDGGRGIIDAGDELDEERPDDCTCHPAWAERDALPCFPCWRAGFETPNPDAEEDE